jgi:hypothetical protein
MDDLLIIFCVAVLPWVLLVATRLIWRHRRADDEEPETGKEVAKGVLGSVLASLFPWFGK